MKVLNRSYSFLAPVVCGLMLSPLAQATNDRSWVSAFGSDSNSCTRALPCATFAIAHANTSPGGEIDVIDPGDYGPFSITKPITIDGGGLASITVTSGYGINVPGAVAATVRNLSIRSVSLGGAGVSGILVASGGGGAVHLENISISMGGNAGNGITVQGPSSGLPVLVTVENATITDCGSSWPSAGIRINSGAASLALDHVRISNCADGIYALSGNLILRDSVVSDISSNAVDLDVGTAEATVERTTVKNANGGVVAMNGTHAYVTGNVFIDNGTALAPQGNGKIFTFGDNAFVGNIDDGHATKLSKK